MALVLRKARLTSRQTAFSTAFYRNSLSQLTRCHRINLLRFLFVQSKPAAESVILKAGKPLSGASSLAVRAQREKMQHAGFKIVIFFLLLMPCSLLSQEITLKGRAIDPQENPLPNASIQLINRNQVLAQTISKPDGQFLLKLKSPGDFILKAGAPGFRQSSARSPSVPLAIPRSRSS